MSGLIERLRTWLTAGIRSAELRRLDESELGRIAGDVGIPAGELVELAEEGPGAALLLPRRAGALGLDLEALARNEPATLRDMQRVCARCGHHGRCEHDLDRDLRDPRWQSYCPNAQTLRALQAEAGRGATTT